MGLWSEVQSYECNDRAISNSLKRCDLEVPPNLKFQRFLSGEENPFSARIPAGRIS